MSVTPSGLSYGGGEGLAKALGGPTAIIAQIEQADLRGMGRAGFPTHRKWAPVAGRPLLMPQLHGVVWPAVSGWTIGQP